MNLGKTLASVASAGLLVGAVGCGNKAAPAESPSAPAADASSESMPAMGGDMGGMDHNAMAAGEKACCKGMNACKGKGGCAVEGKNACAGKNECKGKGGCNGHCPQ